MKWKKFEKAVYHIQKQLSPKSIVEYDYKADGHTTERKRQIDIAVFDKIGQFDIFIAIECKDYKNPVDIKEVEAFYSKLSDIKAHKGVMVSSNGFTTSSQRMAQKNDIELFTLKDCIIEKSLYIQLPILVSEMTHYSFHLSGGEIIEKYLDSPHLMKIYNQDNQYVGDLNKAIYNAWNCGNLVAINGCGVMEVEGFKVLDGIEYFSIGFGIQYCVSKSAYLKKVQVTELADFIDVLSEKLILKHIKIEDEFRSNPVLDETYEEIGLDKLSRAEIGRVVEARLIFEENSKT